MNLFCKSDKQESVTGIIGSCVVTVGIFLDLGKKYIDTNTLLKLRYHQCFEAKFEPRYSKVTMWYYVKLETFGIHSSSATKCKLHKVTKQSHGVRKKS